MVREFKLPDVGEGVAEGELVSWLVEPGDAVTEDQPVAEVETDKALVEVPSPVNGTVKELRAEAGEMVPVGDVIIVFNVEGEDDLEDTTSAADAAAAEAEAVESDAESADAGADAEAAESDAESADAGADAEAEEPSTPGGRVFAAPSARRLARELGVDVAAVEGTGPSGRVTDADVRAHAEGGEEDAAAAETGETAESAESEAETTGAIETEATTESVEPQDATRLTEESVGGPDPAGREKTLAAPATRRVAEEEGVDIDDVPASEERDGQAFVTPEAVREYAQAQQRAQETSAADLAAGAGEERPREERDPYRGVRKAIGDQMERSKFTAPHVTHHDEVDVTELVAARGRLKDVAEERGFKLSYMPFVMKACVAALREYPLLNASLDEENEQIVRKNYYNVGVATATEAGLMVPVLKDVDRKGMLELSGEMNELVQKARERSISLDEMKGGTFTITNVGVIGGEYATPIINYPEVGILALGAIKDKPRVVDGEIVPRKVMTLSLSFDHRVVDGAYAARFTNEVKQYLEEPELLLLE